MPSISASADVDLSNSLAETGNTILLNRPSEPYYPLYAITALTTSAFI
ncbi:MAG: hypothetical protein IBX69_10550 [Anaerolineales bacterium]|nr:hypothetical protein [Anaerolineales bacterium]